MGKRGPAPLPPDALRTVRVNVYLHPSEADTLDRARSRVGLERGPYMRLAALNRLPPSIPELNRTAWLELARLASNLNQLSRAVNEGRADLPGVDLVAMREAVDGLRAELLGMTSNEDGDDDESED